MNNSKSLVLSIAFAIAILNSTSGFAQMPPDILMHVPSDCSYIAVVNVKQMVESPIYYAKSQDGRRLLGAIADDLDSFVNQTGADPVRDIAYLIVSDRLVIANGRFDQDKIKRYMQSRTNIYEMKYSDPLIALGSGGRPQFIPAGTIGDITAIRMAFLTENEIAIGQGIYVAAALRTTKKKSKSIRDNPMMETLLESVQSNATIWFVGLKQNVIDKAPVPVPIGAPNPSIKGITGSFNLAHGVSGNVSVITSDSIAAKSLAKIYDKLEAAAQIKEIPTGLKWLAEGLKTNLNGYQINLSLNYSVDALDNLREWSHPLSDAPESPVELIEVSKTSPENTPSAPIELFRQNPPYTDEARKVRAEGSVLLQCVIRKSGTPDKIKVLSGLGYGLDESAINTIKHNWRFIPALFNGKPVDIQANIEVSFRLY
jgi:TonB family protein